MAVVNIPVGGQVVGIEVPDFALEATQRDIFDVMRQQVATLQSIEATMTGQTTTLKEIANETGRQSSDRVVDELKNNTKSSDTNSKKLLSGISDLTTTIFKSQKASDMVPSVLGALGNIAETLIGGEIGNTASRALAGLGTVAGTVIGIMEQYGEATSKSIRIGIGLSQEMDNMSDMAGRLGVTFDQLASIAMTYGENLRTLGSDTFDGARNLETLTDEFKEATRAQGYYGLANSEMIQLLLEEAELRRQTIGQLRFDNLGLDGFAASVAENIRMSTALARITGQEVQARIAARREIEQNAVAQSFFRDISDEAREKLLAFVGNMSSLPGGNEIARDMVEALATNTDFAMDDPSFYSFLGAPAREMFNMLREEILGAGSMDMSEFVAQSLAMQSRLGDGATSSESLEAQARMGNEAARRALAIRTQTRDLGLAPEIRAQFDQLMTALAGGEGLAAAGIAADAEEATASINSALRQLAEELLGTDLGTASEVLRTAIQAFSERVQQFTTLLESDAFLPPPAPDDYTNPAPEIPEDFGTDSGTPVTPTSSPRTGLPIEPTEASFSPTDFRDAILEAFTSLMQNGGLPVNVRNTRDFPTPTFTSSA